MQLYFMESDKLSNVHSPQWVCAAAADSVLYHVVAASQTLYALLRFEGAVVHAFEWYQWLSASYFGALLGYQNSLQTITGTSNTGHLMQAQCYMS